jgi:hypothetical protein
VTTEETNRESALFRADHALTVGLRVESYNLTIVLLHRFNVQVNLGYAYTQLWAKNVWPRIHDGGIRIVNIDGVGATNTSGGPIKTGHYQGILVRSNPNMTKWWVLDQ